MNEAGYKELKKGGMMRQAEAGRFSVRLHVVGGRLTTPQLRSIREAADRFGRGEIHLTSRQGVEIPNVPQDALAALKNVTSSLKTEGHRVTNVSREEGIFLLEVTNCG